MNPTLTELLAIAVPAGGAVGAAGTFLLSPLRGRPLLDDVLRGAGVGGVLGTIAAFGLWAADELAGGLV